MSQVHADRNLLFGILALQMDFVTRDQLVAAMNAWVLDKTRPLGDLLQVVPHRTEGADGREALLRVVMMLFQVLADQRFEQRLLLGGQGVLFAQDLAERFGLVEDPGVHGGDEGVAADEVHL